MRGSQKKTKQKTETKHRRLERNEKQHFLLVASAAKERKRPRKKANRCGGACERKRISFGLARTREVQPSVRMSKLVHLLATHGTTTYTVHTCRRCAECVAVILARATTGGRAPRQKAMQPPPWIRCSFPGQGVDRFLPRLLLCVCVSSARERNLKPPPGGPRTPKRKSGKRCGAVPLRGAVCVNKPHLYTAESRFAGDAAPC